VGGPHIDNQGRIEIGARFLLRSDPARSHLETGPGGVLRLGDDVEMGDGTGIAAHGEISVGSGTVIGRGVLLMDTNFHKPGDWRTPARPGKLTIGRGVRIGDGAVVLPGAVIADLAVVGASAVVSGKVASGLTVEGVPARPRCVRRANPDDLAQAVREVIKAALDLPSPPLPKSPTREVPGWTLLGGLRVLLDLEESLGVSIPDLAWARVSSVADAIALVKACAGAMGG
jgi:acetyltransferase-like isoleucine patch superfamily enzyme